MSDYFREAVLQEVYERSGVHACYGRKEYDEITLKLQQIAAWSQSQEPRVRSSYMEAVMQITAEAAAKIETIERSTEISKQRVSIPKPPMAD